MALEEQVFVATVVIMAPAAATTTAAEISRVR